LVALIKQLVTKDGAVMQLVTRCSSAEEFVDRFARFATETDFLVPVLPHVTVGTAGQFAIRLQDRSVIMQGRCEVTEIQPGAGAAAGPLGRGLMRLRLREMDAPSWGIHLRLMERRASVPPPAAPPPPVVPPESGVVEANGHSPETEPTEALPLPRPETRAPGASFTLPANPLSDLDAADLASFVELTLLETNGPQPAKAEGLWAVLDRGRQIGRRALPYVSCVCLGFLPAVVLRSGAPRAATAVAQAPPAAPPAAPAPQPQPASPAPPECTADLTTTPAGAAVFWGDLALGQTPVEHAAVPCGRAVVRFRHERYVELARSLAVDPGQPATLDERLYRPPARLVVTSSPPNAVVLLNSHRVGRAPRKISTLQYEQVRVELSLPGYRPWKKKIYVREAESNVDAALVPISAAKKQDHRQQNAHPK
jgi:hypothetical protein